MRPRRSLVGLLLACALAAGAQTAGAQQMYRWTDSTGRIHITDTPPPPGARNVQKKGLSGSTAAEPAGGEQPFALAQAVREFPVVLYTAPLCKDPCARARDVLNQRGVPFREVQVWDETTSEELKKHTGGTNDVPTLLVGKSVQRGFARDAYDALLDSARYPRAGILPARRQAAPAAPEGYTAPEAAPKAEPVPPPVEEKPAASGPYAPGAPRPQKK